MTGAAKVTTLIALCAFVLFGTTVALSAGTPTPVEVEKLERVIRYLRSEAGGGTQGADDDARFTALLDSLVVFGIDVQKSSALSPSMNDHDLAVAILSTSQPVQRPTVPPPVAVKPKTPASSRPRVQPKPAVRRAAHHPSKVAELDNLRTIIGFLREKVAVEHQRSSPTVRFNALVESLDLFGVSLQNRDLLEPSMNDDELARVILHGAGGPPVETPQRASAPAPTPAPAPATPVETPVDRAKSVTASASAKAKLRSLVATAVLQVKKNSPPTGTAE